MANQLKALKKNFIGKVEKLEEVMHQYTSEKKVLPGQEILLFSAGQLM